MKNPLRFPEKLKHKLGLGTWQLGGSNFVNGNPVGWGDINKSEGIEIVLKAFEEGIRFIDTSDSYGMGLSEEIIGQAIKQTSIPRSEIIICTKFGHREIKEGEFIQDFSEEWIRKAVDLSLSRLNTNYLDILLFHSPQDNFNWLEYDTNVLENLVKNETIKQYGVSSKSVYGAEKVMQAGFGSVIEIIYNLLDRRAEELLFNHKNKDNFDIIGRVPLASGFLSSKSVHKPPQFATDDYRSKLNPRDLDWLKQNASKMSFLEEKYDDISNAAISFCLGQDKLNIVIPGCRNTTQLKNNVESLKYPVPSLKDINTIKKNCPDVPNWWKPA